MKPPLEEYPLYDVSPIDTLQDLLRTAVGRTPDKLALEDLNATPLPRVTFAELLDRVARFGRALRRLGLAERDHEVHLRGAITARLGSSSVSAPLGRAQRSHDLNAEKCSDRDPNCHPCPFTKLLPMSLHRTAQYH